MRAATLFLSALTACGGAAPASPPTAVTSPRNSATPGIAPDQENTVRHNAPRPFTAEQIRAAMPVGTEMRFRLEEGAKPAVVLHWRVTAADAATMTLVTRILGEDGSVISEEPASSSRWQELAEHATFPADRTRRSEGSVELPAGRFDTIDYVVTENKGGSVTVSTFRFARQLPGPPVSLAVDKDGVIVRKLVLIARSPTP